MRRGKYSAETISNALREGEESTAASAYTKLGTWHATYDAWKRKYGGMNAEEIRRLWALQKENKPVTKFVQGSLDLLVMQTLRNKGRLRPSEIRCAIKCRSKGLFWPKSSSLSAALERLGKYLTVENIPSATGSIVSHYKLTPAGEEHLEKCLKYWRWAIKGITPFLYGYWD